MKHISIALCLCGMILMNTSCDNYDDTYPQEYEKILSPPQPMCCTNFPNTSHWA